MDAPAELDRADETAGSRAPSPTKSHPPSHHTRGSPGSATLFLRSPVRSLFIPLRCSSLGGQSSLGRLSICIHLFSAFIFSYSCWAVSCALQGDHTVKSDGRRFQTRLTRWNEKAQTPISSSQVESLIKQRK